MTNGASSVWEGWIEEVDWQLMPIIGRWGSSSFEERCLVVEPPTYW